MRYVIYGAGAIGGVIGAKLFQAGREVVLIARGEHLRAIQADGLRVQHPLGEEVVRAPAVGHPAEAGLRAGDAVLLAMKAQDTPAALAELYEAGGGLGDSLAVVCCQNGVENERQALRLFPNVYGVCVLLPAGYLQPGIVDATVWPEAGALDLGRYPQGVDATAEAIAADLRAAGFLSQTDGRIMRQKYGKLYQNVANVVQAVCGRGVSFDDLIAVLRAEAAACFQAAGIDWTLPRGTTETDRSFAHFLANRAGNSTWQSLARGAGSVEVDYLNGEVVLLGRLYGVPTPANALFQAIANEMARTRREPGCYSVEEMRRLLAQHGAAVSTS